MNNKNKGNLTEKEIAELKEMGLICLGILGVFVFLMCANAVL